jgi:hypothetical protein
MTEPKALLIGVPDRQLSTDTKLLIKIVKGHFDRINKNSWELAELFIARHIYGVNHQIDRQVLALFLRETWFVCSYVTVERLENFHSDALSAAFKWQKEFNWTDYINFHFAQLSGLRVYTGSGQLLLDLETTPEDDQIVLKLGASAQ